MTGVDGVVYEVMQSLVPLITKDGYDEIIITMLPRGFFRPLEEPEEDDPEPPSLEAWYPEVPFSEN